MRRFLIKEGFLLKSHKPTPRSMNIGEYYVTDDEEQITELLAFAAQGSCEEKLSKPKEEKKEEKPAEKPVDVPPADPVQDLTTVPGIGNKVLTKLAKAGIQTVDQLKAFVGKEEAKELLGGAYEKILKHFTPDA